MEAIWQSELTIHLTVAMQIRMRILGHTKETLGPQARKQKAAA